MFPGDDNRESQEAVSNREPLISKDENDRDYDDDDYQDHGFFRSFLRRLSPANVLPESLWPAEMKEELHSMASFAGPIILTTFLMQSRSAISIFFLGHLGKAELAGGSLALGFTNITGHSIFKGLSNCMGPICCQAYGAQRYSVLTQTFLKTLILLFLVSIPISILWINSEPIFLLLGQDPDITRVAKVYLLFTIPELLAQAHFLPLRIFLRSQGLSAPLTTAALCAAVLHLPMNYFFVTHLEMGREGVAIALALNTWGLNTGLMIYIAVSDEPLKPWNGVTFFSIFQGWKTLLNLAVPSAISVCMEWWWYEIMLFLCGLLSEPQVSVAAMGILIQTTGILYIVPFSISAALTTRVGHALGAGQPVRAQWTAIVGLVTALGYGFSALIFMMAVKSQWGRLFTDDPKILELISISLPVLGFCEVSNSPQTAAGGVLTGTARPKLGVKINLYAFYGAGLPVAVLATFVLEFGFMGLWFGLFAAQASCLLMLVYTLVGTDWGGESRRAMELADQAVEDESWRAVMVDEREISFNF